MYNNIIINFDCMEGILMASIEKKLDEQYGSVFLTYEVKDSDIKKNAEKLEQMKKALDKVGFSLNVDHNILSIYMRVHDYAASTTRNAGRKKSKVKVNDGTIFYSDIVYMMQTMTDKEISDKINMKIATYYRHKKELKESNYYRFLDKNKLNDLDYLQSANWNFPF